MTEYIGCDRSLRKIVSVKAEFVARYRGKLTVLIKAALKPPMTKVIISTGSSPLSIKV